MYAFRENNPHSNPDTNPFCCRYKKGMLKAKVDDPETIGLINGAAAGMLATVDVLGVNAVQNWEVDELLDWTTGLNFDDYWSSWKELATSAKSEKHVGM